jgi:hypothetical protein
VGFSRLAGSMSVLFRGINYMCGLGPVEEVALEVGASGGRKMGWSSIWSRAGAARTILLWSQQHCKTLSNSLQNSLRFL